MTLDGVDHDADAFLGEGGSGNIPGRLVDGGRFMQRIDVPEVGYAERAGSPVPSCSRPCRATSPSPSAPRYRRVAPRPPRCAPRPRRRGDRGPHERSVHRQWARRAGDRRQGRGLGLPGPGGRRHDGHAHRRAPAARSRPRAITGRAPAGDPLEVSVIACVRRGCPPRSSTPTSTPARASRSATPSRNARASSSSRSRPRSSSPNAASSWSIWTCSPTWAPPTWPTWSDPSQPDLVQPPPHRAGEHGARAGRRSPWHSTWRRT